MYREVNIAFVIFAKSLNNLLWYESNFESIARSISLVIKLISSFALLIFKCSCIAIFIISDCDFPVVADNFSNASFVFDVTTAFTLSVLAIY